jgi:hypothetical protein
LVKKPDKERACQIFSFAFNLKSQIMLKNLLEIAYKQAQRGLEGMEIEKPS